MVLVFLVFTGFYNFQSLNLVIHVVYCVLRILVFANHVCVVLQIPHQILRFLGFSGSFLSGPSVLISILTMFFPYSSVSGSLLANCEIGPLRYLQR